MEEQQTSPEEFPEESVTVTEEESGRGYIPSGIRDWT